MDHPYQSKTQKSFSILFVLAIVVAGGFYLNGLTNQQGLILESDTVDNYIPAPGWVGVAAHGLNYTENTVPIVLTSYSISETSQSDYDPLPLEIVSELAQQDINQYCLENNIDYQFCILPYPTLSSYDTYPEAVTYLKELDVELVVGFDDFKYEDGKDTIDQNNLFVVSPLRSTSSVVDSPSNWLGIRTPSKEGLVEAKMLLELEINAVVVLQNDWRLGDDTLMDDTYNRFKETYEAAGGAIYERVYYPQPDIISSLPEDNNDFTQYLAEADSCVANAIQEYSLDHVGVFVIGFESYPLAYQAKGFENLIKVPWSLSFQMGFAVLGQDAMGEQMSMLKGYSAQEIIENIEVYTALTNRARELNPSGANFNSFGTQEAMLYDACWLMALSVIEAGSSDPAAVQLVFPQVAAEYTGVNGNYRLDENGDRDNYLVGIVEVQEASSDMNWAYVPAQIGVYFSETGVVEFHEPVSLYNIVYP